MNVGEYFVLLEEVLRLTAVKYMNNCVTSTYFLIDIGVCFVCALIVENFFFSVYVHQECKALLTMLSRRNSVALQSLTWGFLHIQIAFDMYSVSFPVALFNC